MTSHHVVKNSDATVAGKNRMVHVCFFTTRTVNRIRATNKYKLGLKMHSAGNKTNILRHMCVTDS